MRGLLGLPIIPGSSLFLRLSSFLLVGSVTNPCMLNPAILLRFSMDSYHWPQENYPKQCILMGGLVSVAVKNSKQQQLKSNKMYSSYVSVDGSTLVWQLSDQHRHRLSLSCGFAILNMQLLPMTHNGCSSFSRHMLISSQQKRTHPSTTLQKLYNITTLTPYWSELNTFF